jgi:hypothetical protein
MHVWMNNGKPYFKRGFCYLQTFKGNRTAFRMGGLLPVTDMCFGRDFCYRLTFGGNRDSFEIGVL